jgi:hypothetical protein
MKILDFRTFLPNSLLIFKNLLAFQQAWLLAGKAKQYMPELQSNL